jgi:hypothetical protein
MQGRAACVAAGRICIGGWTRTVVDSPRSAREGEGSTFGECGTLRNQNDAEILQAGSQMRRSSQNKRERFLLAFAPGLV